MKNQPLHRTPELDGVRGIAVLFVVIYHLFIYSIIASPKSPLAYLVKILTPLTVSGVDLFFVLSGFLIGGILLDNRDSPNYFRVFYTRRIFRILPLYFTWLFLFYILRAVASGSSFEQLFVNRIPTWHFWVFTQNFALANLGTANPSYLTVTWSLAIEEQFYLLAPLAIFVTPPAYLVRVLLVILFSGVMVRTAIASFTALSPFPFIYETTYTRLDGLLCGILCAILVRNGKAVSWLKCNHLYLRVGSFGVVIAIVLVASSGLAVLTRKLQLQYLFFAVGYSAILLSILTQSKSWAANLVRWRPIQQLGILAYGIYLFHSFINEAIHLTFRGKGADVNSMMGVLLSLSAFSLTIIIAHYSWVYFERPLVNRVREFNYQSPLTTGRGGPSMQRMDSAALRQS
jgi:peptidoglycan/LPS O-acetylase OafA/YrhL